MSQVVEKGHVRVADADIYYETHGAGAPLVMLHGGVDPSPLYGAPLTEMARNFKVVAIHARGHGFSGDTDVPWSLEQAADDVAAVLDDLGIKRTSVMGYSFGAKIAIQFALRHGDRLEKLVVISAGFSPEGDFPEVREAFAQMSSTADAVGASIAQSPLAQLYPGVDWARLMHKSAALFAKGQDWTQGISGITAPTLLIFADADSVRPEHMVEFYKLLGGGQRNAALDGSLRSASRLAVIPGVTHYNIIGSPAVTRFATDFLLSEPRQ